ncbi:MAG: hypothetical protein JWP12_1291 [Bacteroidetes bacterium]|nr:hypothetical protein [Bacteroidota bacterium]
MYKFTTCLLIIGTITLTGLPSCKKDYTCVCKTTSGYTYNSEIKTTKKKAKSFCSDQETSTKTCTLQ